MNPIDRALADAARALQPTSDTARLDAELLMAAALGIDRDTLLLNRHSVQVPPAFAAMVERRRSGEPVAYITGRRAFWDIELEVGPGVLVPRPDSEVLIAAALDHFASTAAPARILDLGTGPGTLLLAALDLWPRAIGLGVDCSSDALAYARRNAERLGLLGRAEFRIGDWARGIDESFDLILCNPPYVAEGAELGPGVAEHEPAEALLAGATGLEAHRVLAPQIPRLLAPGGIALVELGADQGETAPAIFARDGLAARLHHDLAGRPRAVALIRV